jgi:hypothetical protein
MGEEQQQQEPTIDTWTLRTKSKLYERTSQVLQIYLDQFQI